MNDKNEMIWELVGALWEIRHLMRQPAGNSTNLAFQEWFKDSAELINEAENMLDGDVKLV